MFETSYDSFTYTFAYLLLWDVVIRFFDDAPAELRFQYSDWLKYAVIAFIFFSKVNIFVGMVLCHRNF